MHAVVTKRLFLIVAVATSLLVSACDRNPITWKVPNMTALTPRLRPIFDKSKTVCFGRFMVDVPASATVVWGDTIVPLTVNVYRNGVDEVQALAHKFIDELKNEKAIYLNDIPLLVSVDEQHQPEGQIVTGYEGREAIGEFKINGYFKFDNDGVVINSRPLDDARDSATTLIKSIARRLQHHADEDIPRAPGNCIESAFLPDDLESHEAPRGELVRIGFRLQEFPDTHISIEVYPSNRSDPGGASLQRQWKRIMEDPATPEETKALAQINFFRQTPRQIRDWTTGYEVLTRTPDEDGLYSYHDFELRFYGVPDDAFKPYVDVQMQTGVKNNAAGLIKPSLTDEEAIALWDKITSTLRVRPTSSSPATAAETVPRPPVSLGELAATGRTCPQTGWWEPEESHGWAVDQRRRITAGEPMPHAIFQGDPSIWQKLTGQHNTYRTAVVWKLVDYDNATPKKG